MNLHRHAGGTVIALGLALALAPTTGCGGPNPPELPKTPDLGGTNATPFIIDWPMASRANLEIAMGKGKGLALVSYGKDGIKLVEGDCKLTGDYGFDKVERKEKVVALKSSAEIRANLPFSASLVAPKLEGELVRGAALELAWVMVGKRTTTKIRARVADLVGASCGQATHFVHGAFIGAAAKDLGSSSNARAAVDVFGAKGSWASASSQSQHETDGNPKACDSIGTEEPAPGSGCGAIFQLELVPVDGAVANAEELAASASGCPEGFVRTEGKCTPGAAAPVHECKTTDRADCEAMCEKKNAASCGTLAYLLTHAPSEKPDFHRIADLNQQACSGGSLFGCAGLAVLKHRGKHLARDNVEALTISLDACKKGEPRGCFNAGTYIANGVGEKWSATSEARALELHEQACNLGWAPGCNNAAVIHHRRGDLAGAKERYWKACNGADALACTNLAVIAPGAEVDKLLKEGCRSGEAAACLEVARRLAGGAGRTADPNLEAAYKEAVRLFRDACDVGEEEACDELGQLHEVGEGVAQDLNLARENYEKACDAQLPQGCTDLGRQYVTGETPKGGVKRNADLAVKYYAQACDGGNAEGCRLAAELLDDDADSTEKHKRVVDLFARSCELHDAGACLRLARFHHEGDHELEEDSAAAAKLFEKACGLENGEACTWLGMLYEEGQGVTKDLSRANREYAKGCERASSVGCWFLGMNHRQGLGVPQDLKQAFKNFQLACEMGLADACEMVAEMYRAGAGTETNPKAAANIFSEGCKKGKTSFCVSLATMYDQGTLGFLKDADQAVAYLKIACDREAVATISRGWRPSGRAPDSRELTGRGCAGLAAHLEAGTGVEKNAAAAVEKHLVACNFSIGASCAKVARAFETGQDAPKNLEAATRLYHNACNEGDGPSCVVVGGFYEKGKPPVVKKDLKEALALYISGCNRGVAEACKKTGELATAARGERNVQLANSAYARGCRLGAPQQCALAVAYYRGAGKNAALADELAERAKELKKRPKPVMK